MKPEKTSHFEEDDSISFLGYSFDGKRIVKSELDLFKSLIYSEKGVIETKIN